jgi:hypothetical protein
MDHPRILDQRVRAYASVNSMATEGIGFELYRPHPWHGLTPSVDPPRLLHAYIEIIPFDPAKYEVDKVTGYLRVDRPQRSSSLPPALFGFPQDVLWTTRRRTLTRGYSSRWRFVRHLRVRRASHQPGGSAARRPRRGRLVNDRQWRSGQDHRGAPQRQYLGRNRGHRRHTGVPREETAALFRDL